MERKKGIPLVAIVIFITLLVAVILTCVIILGANKKNKNVNQNQIAFTNTSEQSETPPEDEPDEGEEITNEDILNQDEDIQNVYSLVGNNKTFAKYAIYSSGGFNVEDDDMPDDLKLKLSMAQVTNSDLDNQNKTVPQEKIEEYAEKLFETTDDIEYKDFSLYDSDTNFTDAYKIIGYVYNEENENYEIRENDVTEDTPSEITELITKAVKYEDKIELYVQPLFVKTFFSNEIQGMGCEIFGDYDFQNKDYVPDSSLIAIAYTDYDTVLKSEYAKDIDGYKYSEVSSNLDMNKVQEYKYTFIKVDDEYKIQAFESVETNDPSNDNDDADDEMTDKDKEAFNEVILEYEGQEKSSSDVKMLLENIIRQNETNADNTDIIIGVTIDRTKVELESDDVKALDDEIKKLEDLLEEDSKYTVKPIYKSGIISSVTITTET